MEKIREHVERIDFSNVVLTQNEIVAQKVIDPTQMSNHMLSRTSGIPGQYSLKSRQNNDVSVQAKLMIQLRITAHLLDGGWLRCGVVGEGAISELEPDTIVGRVTGVYMKHEALASLLARPNRETYRRP